LDKSIGQRELSKKIGIAAIIILIFFTIFIIDFLSSKIRAYIK